MTTALLEDIRAAGWSVAIHNDYRLGGIAYTFWLFTKGNLAVKGEGLTDVEALKQVSVEIARFDVDLCKIYDGLTKLKIGHSAHWPMADIQLAEDMLHMLNRRLDLLSEVQN